MMTKKNSCAVKCLTTGPNAPFLNGVRMQDQTCETQAEADALVATGLFEYTSDTKKADVERAAKEAKTQANQKAADQAGDEAITARDDADAAAKTAADAEGVAKARASTAKKGSQR